MRLANGINVSKRLTMYLVRYGTCLSYRFFLLLGFYQNSILILNGSNMVTRLSMYMVFMLGIMLNGCNTRSNIMQMDHPSNNNPGAPHGYTPRIRAVEDRIKEVDQRSNAKHRVDVVLASLGSWMYVGNQAYQCFSYGNNHKCMEDMNYIVLMPCIVGVVASTFIFLCPNQCNIIIPILDKCLNIAAYPFRSVFTCALCRKLKSTHPEDVENPIASDENMASRTGDIPYYTTYL